MTQSCYLCASGTNDAISLTIQGSKGNSRDIPLTASTTYNDPFENGHRDVFDNIFVTHYGNLTSVKIHKDDAEDDDWQLSEVIINNLSTGDTHHFEQVDTKLTDVNQDVELQTGELFVSEF